MDKLEWYESVENKINEDIDLFYGEFYSGAKPKKIGPDSYRINPCPVCGHSNSCTLTGNTVHCFSGECGWKGTHITAWYEYAKEKLNLSLYEAVAKLEKFTGYKFPAGTKEEIEAYEKHQKQQAILRISEDFYHKQLLICNLTFPFKDKRYTPLDYMLQVRKRKIETLKDFKVGFAINYFGLRSELLEQGFTKEEIKEGKAWQPEGTFVFFYRHPLTKDIVRTNIKNPFGSKSKEKNELGQSIDGDVIVGYSTGSKFMYFPPNFSFDKDITIVEGEHDVFAAYENGFNVAGVGGQIEREYQLSVLDKAKENITFHTMYDNDDAGSKYTEFTNEYFADRPVKKIKYDEAFNDPDEYFRECENHKSLEELFEFAETLTTDKYKIRRQGNLWTVATRERKLEFTMKGKNDKGSFSGNAVYYYNGLLSDRDDNIQLVKCKAKIKPLNFYLYDHIEEYFNSNLDKKSIDELILIYSMSAKKDEIIKRLAEMLFESENDESIINNMKVQLSKHVTNHENVVDEILKEVNDIQNKANTTSLSNIPKMRVGQYYNVRNGDAYMYFTYVKIDGDIKRKLPFLLRNDGTLIRLDLLKRKDSQCLLLIDNKYELPWEINDAILELNECCLTQEWVEKYKDGKISDSELEPSILIKRIEGYIRKFYYTNDSNIYKVLSLYIYSTYSYELFAQIPYLYLNGSKGSGKSILDECIRLLSFNSKMAVDITEAALFRTLSVEGGVLILDEQENLNSKNARTTDSGMAAILKGGYARSGAVYRVNNEKGGIVEKYTIYGPKVISNIMGMDDVIEDRCIIIETYALKLTKETKMEDPKYYAEERLDEIRELTSKCAISALKNFKTLYDIYNGNLFETGNARLSQILTPILAVAKLVDLREKENALSTNPDIKDYIGEYERSLMDYFVILNELKKNTAQSTPEGIIKSSVSTVAKELWGLVPPHNIEFIDSSSHKYTEAIKCDKEQGWFEINVLHFKCFIEEVKPGETAYARYIPKWIKTVFKIDACDIKRKAVHIENEDLMKEFKGNVKPKVNFYRFYFKDYINMDEAFFGNSKENDSAIKTDKGAELF